ncbi:CbtA family protein [Streptomyces sp. NBC_01619]|uniref:CbtA family protein n=1 Tax=Streptomyces pratisoli TaxID=3139917 RepID=A0ACC6QQU7_9ACTN|nr:MULTISPECIES: CbtA family protein [unclassified Streptomyces]MCX4514761.1 CbtA family protein [Streptomyces sp. NBC_01619]
MNSATVRTLLVRGMIAGVLAGLLAFGLAYLIGEPQVDAAIAVEESASHAHGHGGDPAEELVSRAVQSTAGLATAVLVYGTALGGITALALCFALGRVGAFRSRATAALVALGGFVTVALVPFLKYPANPPAVGDPDTLNQRTALYFLMIALGVLLAVGAVLLGRKLAPRWGNWYATVAGCAVFTVAVGLALAFLPAGDPIPHDFPADVLWQFRLASLGVQALLWTALGLILGHLAQRVLEPAAVTAPATTGDTAPGASVAAH